MVIDKQKFLISVMLFVFIIGTTNALNSASAISLSTATDNNHMTASDTTGNQAISNSKPSPPPSKPYVGPISLTLHDWSNIGTPQPYPWSQVNGSIQLNFPDSSGTINYMFNYASAPKWVNGTLSATYTITVTSGSPVWHWDLTQPPICNMPPFVVLLVWSNKFGGGEFDRWWNFADKIPLEPGTYTLSGNTADPSRWLSVYGVRGDQNPAAFATAMKSIAGIGMTFGGGCYYGHGVYVSNGTANFRLSQFSVR